MGGVPLYMERMHLKAFILARNFLLAMGFLSLPAAHAAGYVVAAPAAVAADPAWARVVEALRAKHGARVLTYSAGMRDLLPALKADVPDHLCFVQTPGEVSREMVAEIHHLTRELDDDVYTDTLWGILTGFDATNALSIARHTEPLVVRKVAGGTEFAMDMVESGLWYDELKQFKSVEKKSGEEKSRDVMCPADPTESLVASLNAYQPDLFITSGHATERDWQIGYRYRAGSFRCDPGALYGLDLTGARHPVRSPNPKVYLPIGNCLMGHIDSTSAMALAWMNSAGVHQMAGYTVETWYGYAGWGLLDYFVEQPGRFTLSEAFYANQQALLWRLGLFGPDALGQKNAKSAVKLDLNGLWKAEGLTAQDARGLIYDRDTLAFYGDPAWSARMAARPLRYDQAFAEKDGLLTFTISPRQGENSFAPVNRNGAQRGHRPLFAFLPRRIKAAEVVEGADLKPVITDNFILIPNPRTCDPSRAYKVVMKVTG